MTRGIIVGDIPPSCWRCSLYDCGCTVIRENGFFVKEVYGIDKSKERPSWCPIKLMPAEKSLDDLEENTDPLLVKMGYVSGWNDCLKEIGK